MRISIHHVKAAILGGIVFPIPCIIVIVIVAKVFELMGLLAAPVSGWIPVGSIGGIAMANIVTVLAILVVSILAGLVAVTAVGRKVYRAGGGTVRLLG